MARLVKCEAKGPLKMELGDQTVFLCGCGLSKNLPRCDGSHKITHTEEEGKTYIYTENERKEIKEEL